LERFTFLPECTIRFGGCRTPGYQAFFIFLHSAVFWITDNIQPSQLRSSNTSLVVRSLHSSPTRKEEWE